MRIVEGQTDAAMMEGKISGALHKILSHAYEYYKLLSLS